jgi:hypothetical protein
MLTKMSLESTSVAHSYFPFDICSFSCLCLAPRRPRLVLDAMGPLEFVSIFLLRAKPVMDQSDQFYLSNVVQPGN